MSKKELAAIRAKLDNFYKSVSKQETELQDLYDEVVRVLEPTSQTCQYVKAAIESLDDLKEL